MAENMVLLETIELTQSAASVTFDNIPQSGYTDLKIVVSARSSGSSTPDLWIRMNGLTTGYSGKFLSGSGASAGSGTRSVSAWAIGVVGSSSTTSNTFTNQEIYIPNYLSSNAKSVSSDSVSENNGTTAYMYMFANLQSSTAAISYLTLLLEDSTNFLANSTFSLYGIAATGTTPVTAPKATGGNIVANDGTYWYHAFLTSGTFTPQIDLTANCLVIGGGGGGGYTYNGGPGGGGAGGIFYATSQSLSATNYAVTIGAGGISTYGNNTQSNGTDSQFGSLTVAKGGGYGGRQYGGGFAGNSGGSGGGGGGSGASNAGGASTQSSSGGTGYGNAGGAGDASNQKGGGGGGAGAAGSAGNSGSAGAGGAGLNTWSTWATATNTGVSGYYAGGGGGQADNGNHGSGGAGGGGGGNGGSGTANTGGGAGGGSNQADSGRGGSGIVIIRYAI